MNVPSLPMVGQDWAGYQLRGIIGRGGMSVVYAAENPRLGSTVAVKVLAPELAADNVFRSRFLNESRIAASLNHPNVVPIYDLGSCGDLLYIAMRYVAGADLRAVLKQRHQIPPAEAVALLAGAARALDAAHRHGLVHRDVKPGNILVEHADDDDPDHVYLSDFGISKHVTSRSGLTATGQFMGTIDYLSPEQIQGKPVDGRTDVYSLGCVLYECLTGRVPFMKDVDAAVIWAHVEEPPLPPSAVRPGLPGRLDEVIGRALAKQPDDRYLTCREFIAAAHDALGGREEPHTVTLSASGSRRGAGSAPPPPPSRAVPPEPPGPGAGGGPRGELPPAPRHWSSGRRRIAAALAALAVIIVAGTLWATMRGHSGPATHGGRPMAAGHGQMRAANHLMMAISQANDATHGLLPPSTCAAHSDSLVTCSRPHFAVDTVSFRAFPAQAALYSAYVAAVRSFGNRLGDSIRTNFGDCSQRLSYGEVGWNHNTLHPKTYSLAQSRSGRLNPSTQAGGRVFCVIVGSEFHLVWTQDAGHILGMMSGAPHKDAYEWWRPVHHNIALSGPPMHM
jgi:Protein kinase domain